MPLGHVEDPWGHLQLCRGVHRYIRRDANPGKPQKCLRPVQRPPESSIAATFEGHHPCWNVVPGYIAAWVIPAPTSNLTHTPANSPSNWLTNMNFLLQSFVQSLLCFFHGFPFWAIFLFSFGVHAVVLSCSFCSVHILIKYIFICKPYYTEQQQQQQKKQHAKTVVCPYSTTG